MQGIDKIAGALQRAVRLRDAELRHTGRTFRTLLRAVLAASKGDHVIVVAHDVDDAKRLATQLGRICAGYGDGTADHSGPQVVDFAGGGKVELIGRARFEGLRARGAKPRCDELMFDHYR